MSKLVVIRDIHADIDRLKASLEAAADATPAFLGDFIDAGDWSKAVDDAAVLTRVRDLIDKGDAIAVMGNHELNAILYHMIGADGQPLRERNDKNTRQHASFIKAFGTATAAARDWTDWFLTLPLWLEHDGLRLVHAAWDDDAIATIRARRPDARLLTDDLPEIADESTDFGRAVKRILNGPELTLTDGYAFNDTGGHRRTEVRIAWWRSTAETWRDAALSVRDITGLPDAPLTGADVTQYPADAPPVLVGHYKMTGDPRIETDNAACLDYLYAPCVYLWGGEERLNEEGLVSDIHPRRSL